MKKYISATEGFFDEDKQLWSCYVGKNNREKTLIASSWGNSEGQAIERARKLAELYNSQPKEKILVPQN